MAGPKGGLSLIRPREGESMKRWIMKKLKEKSDRQLIRGFLVDRREKCTNIYTPFSEKISQILNKLDKGYGFDAHGNVIDCVGKGI